MTSTLIPGHIRTCRIWAVCAYDVFLIWLSRLLVNPMANKRKVYMSVVFTSTCASIKDCHLRTSDLRRSVVKSMPCTEERKDAQTLGHCDTATLPLWDTAPIGHTRYRGKVCDTNLKIMRFLNWESGSRLPYPEVGEHVPSLYVLCVQADLAVCLVLITLQVCQ